MARTPGRQPIATPGRGNGRGWFGAATAIAELAKRILGLAPGRLGRRPGPRPVDDGDLGPPLDFHRPAPRYYAYNYGTDINYQDGQVYYGGQSAGSPRQYYRKRADRPARRGSPPTAPMADARRLRPDGGRAENADMIFQLAVNSRASSAVTLSTRSRRPTCRSRAKSTSRTRRLAWSVGGKGIVVNRAVRSDAGPIDRAGPLRRRQDAAGLACADAAAQPAGRRGRGQPLLLAHFVALRGLAAETTCPASGTRRWRRRGRCSGKTFSIPVILKTWRMSARCCRASDRPCTRRGYLSMRINMPAPRTNMNVTRGRSAAPCGDPRPCQARR